MPNLMQSAAAWLGSQLQTAAGRDGVYKRGTQDSGTITGVVTDLRQEVVDEAGYATGTIVTGWQFVVSELLVNSEQIEPRAGDRWEETLNSVDIAWEAMPPGPKQKCWEWRDTSKVLIVVWFKQVKR